MPHLPADSSIVGSDQIAAIAEGPRGTIWVIHRNGILEQMNRDNLRVIYRTYALQKYRGELLDYGLFVDAPQDVKVASLDEKLIQKTMAIVEQNMANSVRLHHGHYHLDYYLLKGKWVLESGGTGFS